MSLSARDIEEIMQLFERSGFAEMKLEAGELKLYLRKNGAVPATSAPAIPAAPTPAPASQVAALPSPGPGEIDVPSPLLGIFYRAPKPGEAPFIEVGQLVEEETVIGIIEVMKLMNSARAGVRGEVVAIHAANAEMVEYDQPLIRIRKAG